MVRKNLACKIFDNKTCFMVLDSVLEVYNEKMKTLNVVTCHAANQIIGKLDSKKYSGHIQQ